MRERDFIPKKPVTPETDTNIDTDTDEEFDSNIDSSTDSNTDTSVDSDNDTSLDTESNVATDTENEASTDMTPDFEEPPVIDEQPKKMSFFERLIQNIITFFKNILHFLGII